MMRPADEDVTSELLSSSIRKANPPLFDQRLFIILADGPFALLNSPLKFLISYCLSVTLLFPRRPVHSGTFVH